MDSSTLNAIVDIVVAIIAFGGGLGVSIVTQRHTDKRHELDVDVQEKGDIEKRISEVEVKAGIEIANIRKETQENTKMISDGLDELKDLFAELRAVYQQSQAITEIKIERLTDECHKHNSVIERTYKLESASALHEEQIKVANKRISNLERHEENDNK